KGSHNISVENLFFCREVCHRLFSLFPSLLPPSLFPFLSFSFPSLSSLFPPPPFFFFFFLFPSSSFLLLSLSPFFSPLL
ncbi:hypothetical protein ACXWR7_13085, partial [Streptococcus pyogenes]